MRFLAAHGDALLAAALFLGCACAAVVFIRDQKYGAAVYALLCAFGFFHALMSFLDAASLMKRIRRAREEQRAQGLDS